MKTFLWVCVLVLGGMVSQTYAHDTKEHDETLQLGDVGFEHDGTNHELYKRLVIEVNGQPPEPGDEGFQSEQLKETYKSLYSGGKCSCKSGYCRPTKSRPTELGSKTGYDIWVSRQWIPVPEGSLQNETTLSPELWKELMAAADAHVCAYPDATMPFGQNIECAIIPKFVG